MVNLNEIILENNINKRISGSQVIITDGKYTISYDYINNDKYITYISDNNCPEKVLLNINEKGYYEIGYFNDKFTVRNVEEPMNKRKEKVRVKEG
jgi:hypothetical protein